MQQKTKTSLYTTRLGAGLGVIEETRTLLELWKPGVTASQLFQCALNSGVFPNMSARRLRNFVFECFAPRYLVTNDYPIGILKTLLPFLSLTEFTQLLFLFTCRANLVLADFVRQVYWQRYCSGREAISNEDARDFVTEAIKQGKTAKPWSNNMICLLYTSRCV